MSQLGQVWERQVQLRHNRYGTWLRARGPADSHRLLPAPPPAHAGSRSLRPPPPARACCPVQRAAPGAGRARGQARGSPAPPSRSTGWPQGRRCCCEPSGPCPAPLQGRRWGVSGTQIGKGEMWDGWGPVRQAESAHALIFTALRHAWQGAAALCLSAIDTSSTNANPAAAARRRQQRRALPELFWMAVATSWESRVPHRCRSPDPVMAALAKLPAARLDTPSSGRCITRRGCSQCRAGADGVAPAAAFLRSAAGGVLRDEGFQAGVAGAGTSGAPAGGRPRGRRSNAALRRYAALSPALPPGRRTPGKKTNPAGRTCRCTTHWRRQ